MSAAVQQFVHRLGGAGVSISTKSTKEVRIVVTPQLKRECSITTAEPLRAPGKHAFSVRMPVKGVRTAVGFLHAPSTEYLTPDFGLRSKGYVSYGGAGFIYPAKRSTGVTYGEGDTVRAEIDFGTKTVSFYTNGELAGNVPWEGGDQCFPAISMFPGDLTAEVAFH